MALQFHFLIQSGTSTEIRPLAPGIVTFGREPGNDLVVPDPLVSRRHGKFEIIPEECTIIDLGSANGTFVNGVRLAPQTPLVLTMGDVIKLGEFLLTFQVEEISDEPVQEPSPVEVPVIPVEEPPQEVVPQEAPPEISVAVAVADFPVLIEEVPPAAPPPPPSNVLTSGEENFADYGITPSQSRLLNYLPGIYHTDFMARFLTIFETVLNPIEWNIHNFDLFLDPRTAPLDFLPWLESWYTPEFNSTWSEAQRRTLLGEAAQLYAMRGTRNGLSRLLEIYTGAKPEIVEFLEGEDPFIFYVKLPVSSKQVDVHLVERLIDANKPAHTLCRLEFKG